MSTTKLIRPSDGKTILIDRSAMTPQAIMPDGKIIIGEHSVAELERECETEAARKARIRREEDQRAARESAAKADRRQQRAVAQSWPDRERQLRADVDAGHRQLVEALADSPAFVAFARYRAAVKALNDGLRERGRDAAAPTPEFGDVIDQLLDRLPIDEQG